MSSNSASFSKLPLFVMCQLNIVKNCKLFTVLLRSRFKPERLLCCESSMTSLGSEVLLARHYFCISGTCTHCCNNRKWWTFESKIRWSYLERGHQILLWIDFPLPLSLLVASKFAIPQDLQIEFLAILSVSIGKPRSTVRLALWWVISDITWL